MRFVVSRLQAVLAALCVTMMCAMLPMAAFADDAELFTFTESGIAYTQVDSHSVTVGAQSSPGSDWAGTGSVRIPAQVTHEGVTYAVAGISPYAFSNGSEGAAVTSLSIDEGITEIGASAFAGCSGLASVSIPSSVEHIGNFAFANCPNLATLTFERVDATSPVLTCGQGAFSSGIDAPNKLASVTLPARLEAVPASMFQRQTALKTLRFAGDAIASIGQYAFNACTSLEYVEIPALTKSGKMGTRAFYELPSVQTVIFKGDIDYNLASDFLGIEVVSHSVSYMESIDVYRYPAVKTVVFNGRRAGYTMSDAFKDADQFQKIEFYETANASKPVSTALVKTDVAAKDIGSGLAAKSVYSGSIPSLQAGTSWYFAGVSSTQPVPDSCRTYPVSNTNLAYATIVMERDELSTISEPVQPQFAVYAPNGDKLDASAFSVSYLNESGTPVDASKLVTPGTYTLTVAGADGAYSGSVSAQFTIVRATSVWERLDGNAYYALNNHIVSSAFNAESCDTALLVPRSAIVMGTALSALAGAYHAPIIVTNDNVSADIDPAADAGHLNAEARYSLSLLKPSRVILVGYTRDQRDGAQAFVRKVLPNAVYPTFSYTASNAADAALAVYNTSKKSNTTGVKATYGKTAIIIASNDAGYAFSIAPYAYHELAPMFIATNGSSLSADALKAIAADGFTRVIVAGPTSAVASGVESQIMKAGFGGAIERWGADSSVFAASADIAKRAVQEGVLAYDSIAIASPADAVSSLMGAAACGNNAAPLVLSSGASNAKAALDLVRANMGAIECGYVLGTRAYVPESSLEDIRALWMAGLTSDLNTGSVSLSSATLGYTGSPAVPTVAVRDSSGAVLPASAYTLAYYDDSTDRQVNPADIVELGSYSVTARGVSLSGSRSATFTVKIVKGSVVRDGSVTYKATSPTEFQVSRVATSASGAMTIPAQVKGVAVTSIAAGAMKNCVKLTSVTLASTKLTSIGAKALFKCKKLKTLTIRSSKVTKVGSKAFSNVYKKLRVRVPASKVKAYKALFAKRGLPSGATVKKG